MTENRADARFGCECCWPDSADAAETASRALTHEAHLVDESHFDVSIRVCQRCSQRFVFLFTEMIDWVDGDDPQYVRLMPVTEMEAANLVKCDNLTIDRRLEMLGRGRRSLNHDHPKGVAPRSYWSQGISVGPHD
jgi:hypothetical protein